MEIYIIRHGQTVWNKSRRLQGRTDIELNENGIRLAIESGENMKDIYFDKIYCSPLTRAKTTAELIRGERDIELIVDDRLKELCFGEYEGRDFRELVKDLASVFRTRIELRQIGVRDESKMLGGLGICGRPFCCSSFLGEFQPVSIKMAKTQNLSLNQSKISGVCGRLMCCLKNEEETYEELNKKLPRNGDMVTLPDGSEGVVHTVNILRQTVRVVIEKNDESRVRKACPGRPNQEGHSVPLLVD